MVKAISKKFKALMVEKLGKLKIGNPLDAKNNIGPCASEDQRNIVKRAVAKSLSEGAKVIFGGTEITGQGFYYTPTLIAETNQTMSINQEEIFGPVASIIEVNDFDEAMAIANSTEFGLSAGICTKSQKYAEIFKAQIRSGMAMVNLPTAGVDYHVPFGGIKASSYGSREQGEYAKEFYTNVKTIYSMPL